MSKTVAPDQRSYWDSNLDPTNLGMPLADARAGVLAEKPFYDVPDRRAFLDVLRRYENPRVMELGAGLSYQVIMLAQMGYRVIACDLSRARLSLLQHIASEILDAPAASRISYIACRAECLPLREGVVDVIATRAVLIHTHLEQALAECARVLAHSGAAVFTEPLARHPIVNLYRRTLAPPEWRSIARYFGPQEIALMVRCFARTECRYDYLLAFAAFVWQYAWRAPFLFRITLQALDPIDRRLFAWFPRLRRFAWFVTLTCTKT